MATDEKNSPTRVASTPTLEPMAEELRSTRALSDEQSARVRARMKQLIDEHGSGVKAAKAIGISQAAYNRIVNGDPAGFYTAQRLAEHDRVDVGAFLIGGTIAEFEYLVADNPRRWSAPTISAVRTYAAAAAEAGRSPSDWAGTLDEVEKRLKPLLRHPPAKR